jgi:hypothetical protein
MAVWWLRDNRKSYGHQVMHFVARLLFRGIYFRQTTRWAWTKLLVQHARLIAGLVYLGFQA